MPPHTPGVAKIAQTSDIRCDTRPTAHAVYKFSEEHN